MDSICRICLSKEVSLLRNIFPKDGAQGYFEKIQYATGIEISENDHLPNNICETCSEGITAACEIKKKALESESYLKSQSEINIGTLWEEAGTIEKKQKKQTPPESHLKFHRLGLKFLCQACGKSFKFKSLLENHLKVEHLNLILFHCDLCSYTTKFKANLKRHLFSFHLKLRNFSCSLEQCNAVYSTQLALNLHLYRCHEQVAPISCVECQSGFTVESELRVHKKHCSGGQEKKRTRLANAAAVDALGFQCQRCDKIFATRMKFSVHFNHKHKRSNICEICNRKMASSTSLLKHIQIKHNQIKKYQCEICMRKFGHKHTLEAHHNMHTGSKPHKCKLCNFATGDRSTISKHRKKFHNS